MSVRACAHLATCILRHVKATVSLASWRAKLTSDLSHYLVASPHLHLCTENLTPFLSLLPSKGLSGLSALLAHPGNVLGWGFKTEGIDVVMPSKTQQGTWTGWWGGVVDLVPERGGTRGFTLKTIFGTNLPRPFPKAASSTLRLIAPEGGLAVDPAPQKVNKRWVDGRRREVAEWDLFTEDLQDKDFGFWWHEEGPFKHRGYFNPAHGADRPQHSTLSPLR